MTSHDKILVESLLCEAERDLERAKERLAYAYEAVFRGGGCEKFGKREFAYQVGCIYLAINACKGRIQLLKGEKSEDV